MTAFAGRTNNNLKQLGLDINGASYDFNNNGVATQSQSLVSRITVLEAVGSPLGAKNLGLDFSTAGVIKLVQADGTELSTTEPAVITINASATAGQLVTRNLTAALQLTLTGCHWGYGTLGDLTDHKLYISLIDTGTAFILGVDQTGGRETVTPADAETVSTSVTSSEKVFCTSEPASEYNCYYIGWVKAAFDDTGNAGGEDFWTIQTGVGDVNLGRGENKERNPTIDGDLTLSGTFNKTPIGSTCNLGLSLSGGTLSITGSDGTALSATNPGFVHVPSATAGQSVVLKVTTPASFNDDNHASSHLTNFGFGVTETANWANDVPFFLYVINRANSNLDGADGSSVFALARNPAMKTSPAAANNIGDTGAISVTDDQTSILILDDVTVANYTSLQCQLIGALRMRWSTATDDWTVQALGTTDGLGQEKLDRTFASDWTFPTGQNGSAAGYYYAIGEIAWTTAEILYQVKQNGMVYIKAYFSGDAGGDGTTASAILFSYPVQTYGYTNNMYTGTFRLLAPGYTELGVAYVASGATTSWQVARSTGSSSQYGDFTNGSRSIAGTFEYRAFA